MVRGRVEVPSRYDRMAKGAGAVRGVARDRRDGNARRTVDEGVFHRARVSTRASDARARDGRAR